MQPRLWLDEHVLRANAQAWIAYSGVSLRAVVKCDGYGWGFATMIRALEDIAESFCVSDADEFEAVRAHTGKPVIILGAVALKELRSVLDRNAHPSITTREELAIAAARANDRGEQLRVRVALRTAAAWGGLTREEISELAPHLASAGAEVALWMHFPQPAETAQQLQIFGEALDVLRRGGVATRAAETASTFPLARGVRLGEAVRVGIGLFGATGGAAIPGVSCAIRFEAPVLRVERHSARTRLGYAGTMLPMDAAVATLRSGYGDGLPASLQGAGDTIMVGMQYAAVRVPEGVRGSYSWLAADSNLDAFAADAGRPVHEIVTSLGQHARSAGSKR